MPADLKHEVFMVAHSDSHRWFYFARMQTDEVLLIKCFDSAEDGRARFTAHAAFTDPSTPPDAPARESIEVRVLAFFAIGKLLRFVGSLSSVPSRVPDCSTSVRLRSNTRSAVPRRPPIVSEALLAGFADEVRRVLGEWCLLFGTERRSPPHHLRTNSAVRYLRNCIRGGYGLLQHPCYVGRYRHVLSRGGIFMSLRRAYIDCEAGEFLVAFLVAIFIVCQSWRDPLAILS